MAMSAFRRSAAQDSKNKGGGGSKSAWYEKMRLPKIGPTPVLVLKGSYLDLNPPEDLKEIDPRTGQAKPVYNDYFKYRKHKRKFMQNGTETYRDEPCSAGPDPHNPQPCSGCAAMDAGDKSVGIGDAFVFSLVHLIPYHTHPLVDWNTKQIKVKQDGSPLMSFAECEGRLCNYCRVLRGEQPILQQGVQWANWQPNQLTTTFGHRRYLELGKSHLSNIAGFDVSVSGVCGVCKSELVVDGYGCETCNSLVIDMQNEARTDEMIAEAVAKLYPCVTCNRGVLLKESVVCESCEAAGRQFRQDSLFNSVLYLFRQGEGTKSQIMMQRHQPLEEFAQQAAQQGMLPQGKTLYQILEEIGKPYDFVEMFKPRDLEEQKKKMGLSGGAPQQQQYGAYGAQPNYAPQQGGYPPQNNGGYPPQQQQMGYPPAQPGPQQQGYPTQQPQQQFMAPPQQPQQGYTQYAPQQQNGAAPQQPTVGPAPFQPTGRPNFGS